MALLTQFQTFFVSPFGEESVCDDLNRFLTTHRIVNVEKRLIDGERGTGWLFLVEYGSEIKTQGQQNQRIDYREVLNEQEYAFFEKLRQFRKTIAEQQGVPVYAVFTNEHLAGMCKKPPKTLKDIAVLPGVGESRVKQFGGAFLKLCLETEGQCQ
jgi:superfamily II DNA helicase RecQ